MGFTGNLQLDKLDQGQVRFDLAINSALDKLDAHFLGSSAAILSLGHASKTLSFRPLGIERATLNDKLLALLTAIKLGNYTDVPQAGIMRWSGSDFEGYDGTAWKSFTAGGGGGGGSLTGGGTAGKLARWSGASDLADVLSPVVKRGLSAGSGQRTVYTVPAGKKAVILQPYWDASNIAISIYIVPSGGSAGAGNRLLNSQSYDSNASLFAFKWVMNAGDFLVVDSFANTIRFQIPIFEFDANSSLDLFKGFFQSSVPISATTLYTVPSGKQFTAAPNWNLNHQRVSAVGDSAWVHNTTASAITLMIYHNDGTADRQIHSESIPAGNLVRIYKPFYSLGMLANDALKVQASATGLNFWLTGYEW